MVTMKKNRNRNGQDKSRTRERKMGAWDPNERGEKKCARALEKTSRKCRSERALRDKTTESRKKNIQEPIQLVSRRLATLSNHSSRQRASAFFLRPKPSLSLLGVKNTSKKTTHRHVCAQTSLDNGSSTSSFCSRSWISFSLFFYPW